MNIEQTKKDAARYQPLRILGGAPGETDHLDRVTVMRFQNLDNYLDHDIKIHASRGEYRDPTDS